VTAVCAYFVGNINPAILLGRAAGVDVRAQGSGNAGATNAMRSLGKKAGALTFIIDVAKGWAAYFVPALLFRVYIAGDAGSGSSAAVIPPMICGLFVILGHMYPVVFGFRGGKGVATTFGVLLAASPLYAIILFAIVIVFTLLFRRVSLSVLIAVAAALVIVFLRGGVPEAGLYYEVGFFVFNVYQPLWLSVILALVVWKHRGNIVRLIKGQESKLSFGSGSKRSGGEGKGEAE
jgi:glycerol-3-phosphate acyltransferase PlsY